MLVANSFKENNERVLRQLADECDGVCGTLASAIEELGIPRLKATRLVPSYKGRLTLGNPDEYDSAMTIDIERYPRTMVAKTPSAINFALKSENCDASTRSPATMANGNDDQEPTKYDLSMIRNERQYHVIDDKALQGRREVNGEDLAKGYEYGQSVVHLNSSEESVIKFQSVPGLEIVGFVPQQNVSLPARAE